MFGYYNTPPSRVFFFSFHPLLGPCEFTPVNYKLRCYARSKRFIIIYLSNTRSDLEFCAYRYAYNTRTRHNKSESASVGLLKHDIIYAHVYCVIVYYIRNIRVILRAYRVRRFPVIRVPELNFENKINRTRAFLYENKQTNK